jgi:hypothetical protein
MQYNQQLEDKPKLAKLNFLLILLTIFIILIVGFFVLFFLIISCSFWANLKRITPISVHWGLTETRFFSVPLLSYTKTNICNRVQSEKFKFVNYHISKIVGITIVPRLSSTSQLMTLSQ